jgi:hypothetical protein
MRLVEFVTIDEFGKRGPEVYINPEHVRSVEMLDPNDKMSRARLVFGEGGALIVMEAVAEVRNKLCAP